MHFAVLPDMRVWSKMNFNFFLKRKFIDRITRKSLKRVKTTIGRFTVLKYKRQEVRGYSSAFISSIKTFQRKFR